MRFDSEQADVSKDRFERALRAEGIPVMESYPRPLYRNRAFDVWPARNTGCPVAEAACRQIVALPLNVLMAGPNDICDVAAAIEKVVSNLDELRSGHAVRSGATLQ
jgi:dTDP-4-amino-4,6-dideoxygalactose transaminase